MTTLRHATASKHGVPFHFACKSCSPIPILIPPMRHFTFCFPLHPGQRAIRSTQITVHRPSANHRPRTKKKKIEKGKAHTRLQRRLRICGALSLDDQGWREPKREPLESTTRRPLCLSTSQHRHGRSGLRSSRAPEAKGQLSPTAGVPCSRPQCLNWKTLPKTPGA